MEQAQRLGRRRGGLNRVMWEAQYTWALLAIAGMLFLRIGAQSIDNRTLNPQPNPSSEIPTDILATALLSVLTRCFLKLKSRSGKNSAPISPVADALLSRFTHKLSGFSQTKFILFATCCSEVPHVWKDIQSRLWQWYSPFPEHNVPSADSHRLLLCSSVILHFRRCWQSLPNHPFSQTQRPQEHMPWPA